MADYEHLFQDHGGQCGTVADTVRFPHMAVCSYKHGIIVSGEWKYVVDYDVTTLRSNRTELNFGLTGP